GIRGVATITNAVITAKMDARFADSPMHAEGTVVDLQDPIFNGWVTGRGVQLNRVLAAARLQDRYPALRNLTASADLRAVIRGRADSIQVQASGPALATARIPNGPSIPLPGELTVAF